jgi:hypothetical protein
LVVYRVNCGRKALSLKNEQEVIDQMRRIAYRPKRRITHSRPLQMELMYKGQRILQIVRGMDRKKQLLGSGSF